MDLHAGQTLHGLSGAPYQNGCLEVDAKLEHILAKLSGKQEVDSLDSANGDSRSHPVQHVNSISSLSPVQHVNGGGKHIVMGTDKGLATTTTLAPLQD